MSTPGSPSAALPPTDTTGVGLAPSFNEEASLSNTSLASIDTLAADQSNNSATVLSSGLATPQENATTKSPAEVIESLKKRNSSNKVIVLFRAIGNAPIMKQNNYSINSSNKFSTVIVFLRRVLNYRASDPLFLYINSAFAPAPDEIVANLHKCFQTENKLIVNYATTAAWG